MRLRRLLFAVVLGLSASGAARAQQRESWFTRTDAAVLTAGVVSGAVLIGWDRQINNAFRESPVQGNGGVRGLLDAIDPAGGYGAVLAGAALWTSGRLGHDRVRERVGLRSIEAIAFANVFTLGGKALLGRARPDRSPGAPRDFALGRGFGDRSEFQSFPSGHATSAFAFASAIDAELNRIAPEHPAWIVPALYGIASLTAVSRVYRDRHWASDVVMGSAIGFVGGRVVVRGHRDRR